MKKAFLLFFAAGLVSIGMASFAHADSGSLCEQNPDAPMCRPFAGR